MEFGTDILDDSLATLLDVIGKSERPLTVKQIGEHVNKTMHGTLNIQQIIGKLNPKHNLEQLGSDDPVTRMKRNLDAVKPSPYALKFSYGPKFKEISYK
jgi:hypothetical protein